VPPTSPKAPIPKNVQIGKTLFPVITLDDTNTIDLVPLKLSTSYPAMFD